MYLVKFSASIQFEYSNDHQKIDGNTRNVKNFHGEMPGMEQITLYKLQMLKNYQLLGIVDESIVKNISVYSHRMTEE